MPSVLAAAAGERLPVPQSRSTNPARHHEDHLPRRDAAAQRLLHGPGTQQGHTSGTAGGQAGCRESASPGAITPTRRLPAHPGQPEAGTDPNPIAVPPGHSALQGRGQARQGHEATCTARHHPSPVQRSGGNARREALFASALQPSDTPTPDMITVAITSAMHRFDPIGWPADDIGHLSRHEMNVMNVMNETCDRCGPAVRAAYRAARTGQLYLCGHCATKLRPALWAQGWTICPTADGSPGQPAAA